MKGYIIQDPKSLDIRQPCKELKGSIGGKEDRKLRCWGKEVGVFKQRRVDGGKEENGAGTRIAGIGWGMAGQIQSNVDRWEEFEQGSYWYGAACIVGRQFEELCVRIFGTCVEARWSNWKDASVNEVSSEGFR